MYNLILCLFLSLTTLSFANDLEEGIYVDNWFEQHRELLDRTYFKMSQVTLCGSHIFLFADNTLYEIDGMHKDCEGYYVMDDEMEEVTKDSLFDLYDEFTQNKDDVVK